MTPDQQKPMSEVEKAIGKLTKAIECQDYGNEMDSFEKAVRADAIAETEAKFRELAVKWRGQMAPGNPENWGPMTNGMTEALEDCAKDLEQLAAEVGGKQ